MAGDKTNPGLVGGPNQNYAGRVSLTSGDRPMPQEAGAFTFDREQYQSVRATKTSLDKNATQSKPLGQSH